ncbi:Planctomycete cytochrome C [Rosistilla carotiformis]|uniref:Planctomycete cytochrome C n=1 Tax=Rosistilla carotiformis TaxID=2528017 RepID=A0A518JVK2_9BACT|nr:PSD1 and planctomycete cytochrome C domain-containing protein [Rosistilla carotiformis]QDV69570.1 Planctomycete cytochrome C [Rosistilla carotiformis]
MKFVSRICTTIICLTVAVQASLFADDNQVDYETQVKPLLRERCYACHGALKQEGGLRLDTGAFIRQGGDSGAAVDLEEEPQFNLIVERTADTDPGSRMPPEFEGEPLSAEQVDLLKRWIAAGADSPADEVPEADPAQHWSFQPLARPEVPVIDDANWGRNPIDAWIAQGHQKNEIKPQSEADRVLLLRRLSFDLIGLPPTSEEIAAVVNDQSSDWYEKTVDRLLDDPRHGERWARHWMDNWRYSDWWGLNAQLRNSQRHMWHWRDWIVESLNNDVPYDEMVRLMLAADELAPDDPAKLRATGFLARNFYIFNRHTWMDQTVEHVGKGLLGLTMNCAKCHDHKFDPIGHVDYYKMRAFFEPYLVRLDNVPGELDVNKDGIPRVFDALVDAPTYLFIRGDEAQPDKSKAIAPGVPKMFEFEELAIEPVDLPPEAWQPARHPWVLDDHLAAAQKRQQASLPRVEKATTALENARKMAEGASPVEESTTPFTPIVEDFATFDDSRWQRGAGEWDLQPGRVKQTMDGHNRSILQLLEKPPRDFDASMRFRIHGAGGWRSIGIGFDAPFAAGDSLNQSRQFVYASAHAGGPKVQVSYLDNGKSNYPSDGRAPADIQLETDYTLRVQVRGNLINASLNGEPMVASRTPSARVDGAIRLVTFDAIASILEFKLSALPADVKLRESSGATSVDPVVAAEFELALAKAQAAVAQADWESVQARAQAMRTSWESDDAAAIREQAVAAIRAEREHAVAKARAAVTAEQVSVARANADKLKAAEKKLADAKKTLEKAEALAKAEVKDSDQFTPLKGAKWTPTRFQFTGKDDPAVEFPQQSTGRRTALARWITDPRNPLTARVAANHIWTRHLGQPLVASTFDFGRNGNDPTHPELLDWLASELIDSGWNMKHLHRLIVLSSTYRMDSSLSGMEEQLAKDPDNHHWWRRVPIRLESQAVRDAVLAVAGTLNETIGGPSVLPADQDKSHRRSLYFFHSNNEKNLLLSMFDEASVAECYQREQSIVPQQALALSNSRLVLESSQQIAAAIAADHPEDEAFVRQAFLLLLGIQPTAQEIDDCQSALTAWRELPEGSDDSARGNLIWAIINHNDFVTLR